MTRRTALESLLLPFLLLAGTFCLFAQDRWDGILDQYEEICDRCINLRQRIAGGESVPDHAVTALLQELTSLRKTLQDASGTMTELQRTRFHVIQQRYSTASGGTALIRSGQVEAPRPKTTAPVKPKVPPVATEGPTRVPRDSIALPALSPPLTAAAFHLPRTDADIWLTDPASLLPPYEYILQEKDLNISDPGSPRKWSADLLLLYARGSASSYGLMATLNYRQRWGIWLAGRSNFTATSHSYDCRSDGTADGGRFWGNGQSRYGVFSMAGGPLWRPLPWLGIYAGAGYTKEELDWQDAKERWARVSDYSISGICWDAGLLFQVRHLSISAGCSWNTFATLTVGAGVHF